MAKPPSPIDAITPNGDAIPHQPTSPALAPLSLLTSLATLDETLTSPITIPGDLDENMIPAWLLGIDDVDNVVNYVVLSDLLESHDISLPMGGAPLLNLCQPSVDTNLLYHTVS